MWFDSFSRAAADSASVDIIENGRVVADKGRNYIFSGPLEAAIDVALGLGRPLLVSGEPGCGKTELGYAIARRMRIPRVHFFSTKSNSEARDLFYSYDAVGRFRDAQARTGAAKAQSDVADYVSFEALGRAILDAHHEREITHLLRGRRPYRHPGAPTRSVVIIDEVDKASRDFPNDLLREIEDLAFRVPEMGRGDSAGGTDPETLGDIAPQMRPVIIITSNEERQLPDAFLRRCVFHEIGFPDSVSLGLIIASGLEKRLPEKGGDFDLPEPERLLLTELLEEFRTLRLDKRPGISEAIDAAALLAYPSNAPAPALSSRLRATMPALAKLKTDRAELAALIEQRIQDGNI
ncbi:AAA family ATPase [Rhizobium ruizarguesonis]